MGSSIPDRPSRPRVGGPLGWTSRSSGTKRSRSVTGFRRGISRLCTRTSSSSCSSGSEKPNKHTARRLRSAVGDRNARHVLTDRPRSLVNAGAQARCSDGLRDCRRVVVRHQTAARRWLAGDDEQARIHCGSVSLQCRGVLPVEPDEHAVSFTSSTSAADRQILRRAVCCALCADTKDLSSCFCCARCLD